MPNDTDGMQPASGHRRKTECEGSLNKPASDERTCRAAHRLHATHVAWARTAMSDDPTSCYQCHAFARIVLATEDDGRSFPEVMQDEDGETYFAAGHVDPTRFLLAVVADIASTSSFISDVQAVLCEPSGSSSFPAVAAAVESVEHVFYRYDRLPDDDEHMSTCQATDDGALAFTRIELHG